MAFARKDLVPLAAREFAAHTEALVRKQLAEGKEVTLCALLGKLASDGAEIFPVPPIGTKDLFATMARSLAQVVGADFVLIVCEAWKATSEDRHASDHYNSVSEMPGASDVVFFQLECEHGAWIGYSRVAPFEEGKARTMEPVTMRFGGAGDGRFIGLLPKKQTTKH